MQFEPIETDFSIEEDNIEALNHHISEEAAIRTMVDELRGQLCLLQRRRDPLGRREAMKLKLQLKKLEKDMLKEKEKEILIQ